jgi:hypothetical protein
MATEPLVVARALLRSAAGERPGIDVPISADNMARLQPAPQTVAAVAEHFRSAGFEILGTPGLTIGIAGSKQQFEQFFGVSLVAGADDAYTVHVARRSRRAVDPTLLPDRRLPPGIREAISQVSLERAASIDGQPKIAP